MSNEEMNKKMEFIVEQQAQFAADIQVMREVQAQDAKLLKEQDRKLSDAVVTVVGLIGSLTQAQTSTDGRINVLADSFNRLAQAQARTEESLKILINVVERHISGNGGSANLS
jgi:hypothetical protein